MKESEEPVWGSDEDDDGVTGILPPPGHDLGKDAPRADARAALTQLLQPRPAMLAAEVVQLDPILATIATNAEEWPTIGSGVLGLDAWNEVAAKVREDLTPAQRRDFDAKAASMAPETREVLGIIHAQQQKRSGSGALQVALIGLALLALVVVILRFLAAAKTSEKGTAATTPAQAAPKARPPYNPAIHGSIDQFRASYPPTADEAAQSAGVGLDAQAWRPHL